MSSQSPIDQQLSQLVRNERLKKAVYWVAALHVALIVIAAIGLPHWRKEPFDLSQAVAVDLVAPTGEFSAAANKAKSNKPFTPNAKPEVKPEVKPPTAEPEKPPSPVKSDAAEKVETPVEKPPEPTPEKIKEPKKEAIVKADNKVKLEKPKKPAEKKSRDDGAGTEAEKKEFNSVLKNLLGATDAAEPEGNPVDAPADPEAKNQGTAPVTSDTLALSEMDALKYQLAQCWNVPSGAMNAEDLIVDIRVEVAPDRIVRKAEIVDQSRYNSDDFFRAAADSARRAMFNPRCSPLALPPDKYETWKTILIRFNPKEMFGG